MNFVLEIKLSLSRLLLFWEMGLRKNYMNKYTFIDLFAGCGGYGYVQSVKYYKRENCKGCPHRDKCYGGKSEVKTILIAKHLKSGQNEKILTTYPQ